MQIENFRDKKQKLPLYGVGPYLILVIACISIIGILFSDNILSSGIIDGFLRIPFYIIGTIFVSIGLFLWYLGAVKSNVGDYIINNKLNTHGVFAWTRNPMYSGWWFLIVGIMLFWCNLWLLLVIPVQWTVLTLVLCRTEEKWLDRLYGEEYREYCRRVNRLIPCKKKFK